MELWEREKSLPHQKESLRYEDGHFSLHDNDGNMFWKS